MKLRYPLLSYGPPQHCWTDHRCEKKNFDKYDSNMVVIWGLVCIGLRLPWHLWVFIWYYHGIIINIWVSNLVILISWTVYGPFRFQTPSKSAKMSWSRKVPENKMARWIGFSDSFQMTVPFHQLAVSMASYINSESTRPKTIRLYHTKKIWLESSSQLYKAMEQVDKARREIH